MKKILSIILMIPFLALAQTQTENYIKTTAYKGAGATLPVVQVSYFDGLGRPIQQVAHAQSGTGKDIVTHIEYDAFGRQVKDFLPYVNTAPSLNYNTSANTEVGTYYNNVNYDNTLNPFSQKEFEASPLNRVLKQAAPGNDWKLGSGHEIKMDYQTNIAGEVKYHNVTTTWIASKGLYDINIAQTTNYDANQLYKTITKDENWTTGKNNTTEEFKNKEGQIVLKRTYNATIPHETYYVYDIYGNLAYVIPPLAEGILDQTILDGLCYQYKYDYRNRLVEKKLPGKQWEFIVYDKLDRPVATGPAFSPWADGSVGMLITEYDVFNRPVQTGWKTLAVNNVSRAGWQANINDSTNPFTLDNNDILTKNYYDNYTFTGAPATIQSQVLGQDVATNVKGLATGTWTRLLDIATNTTGETSYTLYDKKGRPISSYIKNHLGGFTQLDNKLDFIGKIEFTITTHKRLSSDVLLTVKDMLTYSAQDRLVLHKQQINTLPEQLIVKNTYDELGQLISKNVGGTDISGALGLQKVDYSYNIRGWLKAINDTANLTQGTDPQDLFSFKLSYNAPTIATALFNGNISETYWRTSNDNVLRKYNYSYDNLNRLTVASYAKPESNATPDNYNESVNYDKNGNITSLLRFGDLDSDGSIMSNKIDDLAYSYHPDNKNQLMKVFDSSNNPQGFKDETANAGMSDPADDYTYDTNGNLIKDDNKQITDIKYNHLNLPAKIIFGSNKIEYLYNATGQKIQKKVTEGTTITTTEYLNGFQYKNNVLLFFPHTEGYVNNTGSIYNYIFNYTDHLGNIRMSYTKDSSTGLLKILEENHYYPFGLKHINYNSDSKMYVKQAAIAIVKPVPIGKSLPYQYKYNGKELQDELGLNVYDFGARLYMQDLGRWNVIDPKANEYFNTSSYAYVLNRPTVAIDPDGKRVYFIGGAGNDVDGWEYVRRWGEAFEKVGVDFHRVNASHGKMGDIMFTNNYRNSGYESVTRPSNINGYVGGLSPAPVEYTNEMQGVSNSMIDSTVDLYKKQLKDNPLAEGEQFNLVGYSYGSVLQGQAALKLASGGQVIDNLVLIGSPISDKSDLWKQLNSNKNIKNIIRFDIKGDALSNPQDVYDFIKGGFQNSDDTGKHFDAARPGGEANKLINTIVQWLKDQGVKN